ncbi:unnamed protein product [Sphagnum balticum]
MVVVQEKASQWSEQSYSREEEGQSSNDNNEEAEEEDQRRHFSDVSRTFSLFSEEEISNDLRHQQSSGFETFDDKSHVANTLAIDHDVSSRDALSSSSQVIGNQASLVAHYDVSSSTTMENTQFTGMSRDAKDRMSYVPSKPAALKQRASNVTCRNDSRSRT